MIPSVKILVGYHKPSLLLKNDVFVPIHLGRRISKLSPKDMKWMKENTIGDDTGDNISHKNKTFNELTAIYWAWKNYDKLGNPDFIGFTHYRRHFLFDDKNRKDLIFYETLNKKYIEDLHLERLSQILKENDFVVNNPSVWSDENVYSQYEKSPSHILSDLKTAEKTVLERYPEMKKSLQKYMKGNAFYFCNLFIMKKELFFKYCEYLFACVEDVSQKIDYNGRTFAESRMYISERLTAVYITHLKQLGYKYTEFPMTFINDTEIAEEIFPENKNSVTVVFSINNAYVPYFSVCLISIFKHISSKRNYEFFVLDGGITDTNKKLLTDMCPKNVKIKFLNIRLYTRDIDKNLFFTYTYYDISTYYRFFIPEIFKNFSKILYLDGDIVVEGDIAELFDTDLKENYIGATKDLYMPLWLAFDKKMFKYLTETLKMGDVDGYFQAGVMLFNVSKMRDDDVQKKLFDCLERVKTPLCVDQDIFNSVCFGHVLFVDGKWNFDRNIEKFKEDYPDILKERCLPELKEVYAQIRENPKAVHYAGPDKPWKNPSIELASLWWKYARMSDFYEYILYDNLTTNMITKKEDVSKKVRFYLKYKLRYLKYRFLSKITFGKKKKKYKQKRKQLKKEIKEIRRFLKVQK